MRNNLGDTEEKLEAQTIAQSEWERLSHMSLDELEANRNTLKTPYSAGTGSQYTVSVNLGQKGTFNNGTCGAVSGGYANCFKDTTITVYRDGSRLFTTRTLPLMAGDYTRKEIDAKLSALQTNINNEATARANAVNSLTNRLNGKEFVKNRTTSYDLNLRYEQKAGDDVLKLHAYNGNTEIPLAGGSNGYFSPDGGWYELSGGFIMQWGRTGNTTGWGSNNSVIFPKPFKTDCYFVTYTRTTVGTNNYIWYQEDYAGPTLTLTIGSKTKTGFTFAGYFTQPVIWFAIGK